MADTAEKTDRAVYEQASPTLLATVPAEAPKEKKEPNRDWPRLRSHCEQELGAMRNWRTSWWVGPWADIARYIEPIRSMWLTQTQGGYATPNSQTRGRELNRDILDPCATQAVRVCSAGLMSGLASPSRPWFKVVPMIGGAQLDGAASDWLDEVQSRITLVLATSNFYNSFAMECTDLVTYGTAPVLIYEDQQDIIRLYNAACGEYFLGTDATMRVGTYARNFVLTVSQIVGMFGLENCPPEIQQLWKEKGAALHQEQSIAHIIEPNFALKDNGGEYGRLSAQFSWREVYWVFGVATVAPLSLRGFRDQPFTAGRWITQGNDPYGRSPAMDALPDVKTLQVLTKRQAQAIEKVVNPPLLADVNLKNEPASTIPGGITYVPNLDAKTGMRSVYQIQPDLPAMQQQINDVRARIQKGFFMDLFMMLDQQAGKQMTAYEVGQRMQEKLQVLGPVIEGLLNESLKPKLKRIYSIMQRRGMLPPKPQSIQNMPLDIEFVSMLALAQKAAATGGLERLAGMVGNLIGAFPTVGDLVDSDEFVREYNSLLANPEKILRGPEELQALRQQKAQQQQQSQRLQMLAQGGQAAVQAASTLANTPLRTGSALDAMLGLNGAQPQGNA